MVAVWALKCDVDKGGVQETREGIVITHDPVSLPDASSANAGYKVTAVRRIQLLCTADMLGAVSERGAVSEQMVV